MDYFVLTYFGVMLSPIVVAAIFIPVYLILNCITCGRFEDYIDNLIQKLNRPSEGAAALVFDKYRKRSKEEADGGCTICLGEYEDGERRARIAACNHRYHAVCIEGWMKEHNSCPLCRHDIA